MKAKLHAKKVLTLVTLGLSLATSMAGDPVLVDYGYYPTLFRPSDGTLTFGYSYVDGSWTDLSLRPHTYLRIYSGSQIVRTIDGGVALYNGEAKWDGRDEQGILVRSGQYRAELVAKVQKYAFQQTWGSEGSGPGQFSSPNAVGIDSHDNLYVADTGTRRIQKFDPQMKLLWIATAADYPAAMAIDRNDMVYIVGSRGTVQKFSPEGSLLLQFSAGVVEALGIAVDPAGNIYTSGQYPYDNYKVNKFDPNGNFLLAWSPINRTEFPPSFQFMGATGLAADSLGNIYAATYTQRFIQKFDGNGNLLSELQPLDNREALPRVLTVDRQDNLFATDFATGFYRYERGWPDRYTTWATSWSQSPRIMSSTGIAVDSNGNVYIADPSANRIVKFARSEMTLSATFPDITVEAADKEPPVLASPQELTLVSDPGACTATAVLAPPVASDNIGVASVVNDHPASTFPLGETIVTWTATDTSGNTAHATQKITVLSSVTPAWLSPLAGLPVANKLRVGQVVPHKVTLTDCTGRAVTSGVTVRLSVQGLDSATSTVFQEVIEDATGVGNDGTLAGDGTMQFVDGHYQFNLNTSNFSDANTVGSTRYYLSTVTVIDNATAKVLGSITATLETGK